MVCERVSLPGGGAAIVCSSGRRKRCACGKSAPFLCDWKVPSRRTGTCDAPICADHATEPAPNKHLCPTHTEAYAAWQAAQATRTPA